MDLGKLLIISAPSGSGKSTLVKHLMQQIESLEFSVSATSRKPRGEEKNKVDYYFLSAEEFKQKIENNEFVEWEEVYPDRFYGTLKKEVERIRNKGKTVIFDVDVVGGLNIKKIYGNSALALFIMPPSTDVLRERLRERGTDSEEEIKKRVAKAEKELTYAKKFDQIIVNNSLEKAKKEITETVNNFLH